MTRVNTESDEAKAIRQRIADQYEHLLDCLRAGEKIAATDHAREIIELIKEHPKRTISL